MTDHDVIVTLQQITGIGNISKFVPKNKGHKTSWIWAVTNKPHITWVIELIAPLLSERRRSAAKKIWEVYSTNLPFPPTESLVPGSKEAIAWIAGIFEGEGNIYTSKRHSVGLSVSSTDADVINQLLVLTETGHIYYHPSRNVKWRDTFSWKTGRRASVMVLLGSIEPWLHSRRTTAAIAALNIITMKL
jgi:hypothetical protein